MYTSTIIRSGLLSTFVAASLLASMGLCWHEHWDCLQGKWIACTIVLCGAFIVLLKGRVQKDKFLYLLFATLIGCQISDILANSISIANLLWGLALLSFVSLCKEITNKSWLFIVAICNLLILTMSILQYAIVSIPFSLQILDNPAGNASALVMGICCILPHDFSIRHFSNRWFSVVIVILLSCVVILSGALLYNCSRTGFIALFLSFSIYRTVSSHFSIISTQSLFSRREILNLSRFRSNDYNPSLVGMGIKRDKCSLYGFTSQLSTNAFAESHLPYISRRCCTTF